MSVCQIIKVSEHELKVLLAKEFGATSPYDVYLGATDRRGREVLPAQFHADVLIPPTSQADEDE